MKLRQRCALRTGGITSTSFLAAFLMAGALALAGCDGDPEESEKGDSGPSDPDGGPSRPNYDIEGCVVSVLATDCSSGLQTPHVVELLNAANGESLPGFRTTSAVGGKYAFKNVPGDIDVAVHAIGVGAASESGSTYDTIAFHVREAGDPLLRVSNVGTAGIAGMAAGFTPADDKVALSGAVYMVNGSGRRVGTVGCAQIFVDGASHPAPDVDQRYNASNGIPTTLARLDKTLAGSGRFYIGNLEKGEHTLKVSLDQGMTFIAERKVLLSRVREEAESPFKSLLYLVAIDLKGENPTPSGCPTEEMM
jgi:hypothetical protein